MNSIRRGSEDHWTFTPHEMARVQEGLVARGAVSASEIPGAASTAVAAGRGGRGAGGGAGGDRGGGRGEHPLYIALTSPELRDPRALAVLEPMLVGGGPYADPVRETAAASVRALQSEEPAPAELKKLWQEVQQLQKKAETLEKQLADQKKKAAPVK